MRLTNIPALAASAILVLLLTPEPDSGQPPPAGGNGPGGQGPKPPPDEFRSLLKEVEEAYKAPHEVDKDVLDELRKQYRNPTPEREAKIFQEIRRLYQTTLEQEQAILREIRRAYDRPSAEQEERIFREIRRNGKLPLGTIPAGVQTDQAMKLFARFDQNGDPALSPDEMPDVLWGQWRRWDRNRDGLIDFEEYGEYYRAHLGWVSEKVAGGEIPLKLPKGVPGPAQEPRPAAPPPAFAIRYGKMPSGLPPWFKELDADRDGQVSLSEWRRAGHEIAEFLAMDLDGDGLLPPDEYVRYLRLYRQAE